MQGGGGMWWASLSQAFGVSGVCSSCTQSFTPSVQCVHRAAGVCDHMFGPKSVIGASQNLYVTLPSNKHSEQ